jgi:hypothetical protein
MMEGSGDGFGSVLVTNGSGCGSGEVQKTYRSEFGSRSTTLTDSRRNIKHHK